MPQAGTDRRTQRTRQLLIDALAELLHTKRYDAISVREITDHANVGRSTFYAHFIDKDDLLTASIRRMVGGLGTDGPGRTNTLALSLGLFQHVSAARGLYLSVARGRHLNLFLDALQSELSARLLERLEPRIRAGTRTAVPPPLLAAMIAGMLITAVRTWVESDLTAPAEAVNQSFVVAAEAALRAGLRPAA